MQLFISHSLVDVDMYNLADIRGWIATEAAITQQSPQTINLNLPVATDFN